MIWKTIASAPKDREIMGRVMAYPPFTCEWDAATGEFIHHDPEDGAIAYRPTHWAEQKQAAQPSDTQPGMEPGAGGMHLNPREGEAS